MCYILTHKIRAGNRKDGSENVKTVYKFVFVHGFRQNSDSDRNRILETVPLLWSLSRKDSSLSSLLSPSTLTLLLLDISVPRTKKRWINR